MRWSYLGRVEYRRALQLQLALRDGVARGTMEETLLLLEHPPVITLGRSAVPGNVLVPEVERRRRGVDLVQTTRGGDVTYHGPGQLVGYPVRVVGRAVRAHVEGMTRAICRILERLGIESWWTDDRPGVWTERGKIAAVGVDARGGIAIHGFALNVDIRPEAFQMIVPCGLQAPVTSIAELIGPPALEPLARQLATALALAYQTVEREVDPSELLALTETGGVSCDRCC